MLRTESPRVDAPGEAIHGDTDPSSQGPGDAAGRSQDLLAMPVVPLDELPATLQRGLLQEIGGKPQPRHETPPSGSHVLGQSRVVHAHQGKSQLGGGGQSVEAHGPRGRRVDQVVSAPAAIFLEAPSRSPKIEDQAGVVANGEPGPVAKDPDRTLLLQRRPRTIGVEIQVDLSPPAVGRQVLVGVGHAVHLVQGVGEYGRSRQRTGSAQHHGLGAGGRLAGSLSGTGARPPMR